MKRTTLALSLPGIDGPDPPEPEGPTSALAPFGVLFRRAENARTLAWMALEKATRGLAPWSEAERTCRDAAAIMESAAALARGRD